MNGCISFEILLPSHSIKYTSLVLVVCSLCTFETNHFGQSMNHSHEEVMYSVQWPHWLSKTFFFLFVFLKPSELITPINPGLQDLTTEVKRFASMPSRRQHVCVLFICKAHLSMSNVEQKWSCIKSFNNDVILHEYSANRRQILTPYLLRSTLDCQQTITC